MEPTPRDDGRLRATRIYQWLVRLYPVSYRRLFGEQMLQTFQDHYRDAIASGDESEGRFWLGVFADEVKALPRAQVAAVKEAWRRWAIATPAARGREETIMMTRRRPRLRSYWLLYLLLLLFIPIAATVYGQRNETVYESTATIYVQTNTVLKDFQSADDNSYATKAQNVSDAMGQILQTETFLVSVARDTSLKTMYDLGSSGDQDAVAARIAGNITVSANNATIVVVTATDRFSPQVAQELAGAAITEFVAFYANQELATLTQAQEFYGKQLDDITAKVADDTKKVSDYQKQHPEVNTPAGENDPAYVELKKQREADQATQQSAQANADVVAQAMEAAKTGTSYDVKPLDPPTLPLSATVKIAKVLTYSLVALVAVLILFSLTGISYRPRVTAE
jgi:murein DD-endopeptidase MepM/ murein hydrolase activator NlpD